VAVRLEDPKLWVTLQSPFADVTH